jgi:hypothetical protein
MNPLKAIYWNQYYELKQKGKAHVARKQGTLLVTIAITLIIFSIFYLLMVLVPDFEKETNRFLKRSFGRNLGRSIGKILAILLIIIIYPIINFTIGSTKTYHDNIVKSSLLLSADEQKELSKKGLKMFILPVILFGIAMIALLIKTFIL